MTRYLLTDEVIATELWSALETNPTYTQNLTTKATVAKNAAGTYFKYRPGVTVTATDDFPAIANAKSGWRISSPFIVYQPWVVDLISLYNGSYIRAAQKITLNATIAQIIFYITKYGSPTGTVYSRIRKVSDDSITATSSTTLDAATFTQGWNTFVYANVVVNEAVYLTVEFSGGDSSNHVHVGNRASDVISGNTSLYINSWTDQSTWDLAIKIFGEDRFNGSFAAGNWTFKVALYNNTKYGHAVKIAARLSRSVNADGSNATLIGAVTESPNTITLAGAAGDIQTDTWTYDPGAVTLTNEYLFVEYRCVIVTPASNAGAQHDFICDEDPATRDESITPTTFTPGGGATYTKTFTADSQLLKRQTKTFTSDARLLKTLSKTFMADAYATFRKTKTFTADSQLLKRQPKTFLSDAKLLKHIIKTLTLDAYLTKRGTKTFSVDAWLTEALLKGFLTDAQLLKRQTKQFTADGNLIKRQPKTFSADAFLEYVLTKGLTTDGLLLKRQPKQFSSDAVLLKRAVKTFMSDAILEAAGFKAVDTDALLLKRMAKTFSADALLTEAQLKGFTTDALLLKRITATFTVDAILESAVLTKKTFKVDAILLKRQTATFTVDAYLTTPPYVAPPPPIGMVAGRYKNPCLLITADGHLLLNINMNKPHYILID